MCIRNCPSHLQIALGHLLIDNDTHCPGVEKPKPVIIFVLGDLSGKETLEMHASCVKPTGGTLGEHQRLS